MRLALHRSSSRGHRHWRNAVVVRVTITPTAGTSATVLYTQLSAPACPLGQQVTEMLLAQMPDLPLMPEGLLSTQIRFVSVVPHRTPPGPPELFEPQPDFFCWYNNEDDPRSVVCGRDTFQCQNPTPAPNLATARGRCLFPILFPLFMLLFPIRLICPG
mmetsp:Transcript_13306/g.35298  ORF Transcript_13306/g.35298 Transcript_13306/m.35298 type:complete len:159 (-) Transcript_13306:203-679(-)